MSDGTMRKYTVADVYGEAARLLKDEMRTMKKRELSASEELRMKELAKLLSKTVLHEMRVV